MLNPQRTVKKSLGKYRMAHELRVVFNIFKWSGKKKSKEDDYLMALKII